MFAHVILVCAVIGVAINITAIFFIRKKRDRSVFHDLLIILNTSDVGVVVCCALLFALPHVWQLYRVSFLPHVGQFLLPSMHIAVMTSVYSTILIRYIISECYKRTLSPEKRLIGKMHNYQIYVETFLSFSSFERYIRICFYCQLKETSILSDGNIKYYKMFVILFPILFYIPKFFEVQSHYETKEVKMEIDCGSYINLGKMLNNTKLRDLITQNMKDDELAEVERLATACKIIIDQEKIETLHIQNSTVKNVTKSQELTEIPIKHKPFSTLRNRTIPSIDSTIILHTTTTSANRKRRHKTNKQKRQTTAKRFKTGLMDDSPFIR